MLQVIFIVDYNDLIKYNKNAVDSYVDRGQSL